MKQVKQICFPLLLALLTTVSMSISIKVTESSLFEGMLRDVIDGIGLNQMIIFAALAVFYMKGWKQFIKSARWITHILAGIFAVFMLIGLSYSQLGNWDFILGNRRQLVIALIAFAGYFILFDLGISLLYNLLARKNSFFQAAAQRKMPGKISRHYGLFSFGVISICWLPYLLMHLPGSVPHDGYRQINMFYGIEQISNHHPWVLTEFYGMLMEIGRGISDNFGVFLITLVSFLIEALCYSVVCSKVYKWKVPAWMNICVLLFFAVLPPFGAYAQAVIKDSLFCALLALFFVLYVDVCISAIRREKIAKPFRTYILLFIIEVLVCLTRNNGIYMILPADILLLFFVLKGSHRYVILMTICVCCSYYCVNNVLAGQIGVEPGSRREMLSIPFQQTARYLKEYPDDVTAEEREAISGVLSYDLLADYYDPEISDHVKSTFNDDATDEELREYFLAWASMFRRHPGVYFEATLNNTYGYYYPFYNCDVMGAYQFYIKGEPIATGDLDIHYIVPEKVRLVCDSYAEFWRNIPGLALLVNPAAYTWILLMAGGYLIYNRKYKSLLILAAPLLNVAICIASPVNGLLRYAMPLMACTPVLLCWCYVYVRTKFPQKQTLQDRKEKQTGRNSHEVEPDMGKKDIFDRIMEWRIFSPFHSFYKKYKEILLYLFFGGLSFIVSIGTYALFEYVLNFSPLIANIFSWIFAVTFAYVTNRIWVFADVAAGFKNIIREILSFYAGRVVTLLLEEVILYIGISKLGFNSILVKIIGQIVVIVSNYFISKIIVFRSRDH